MMSRNYKADKALAARAAEGARVLPHAERDGIERFFERILPWPAA